MTDDDGPLFPPQWEWDGYEEAFREASERMAQAFEADAAIDDHPLGPEIGSRWARYEDTKALNWWDDQVVRRRLPDDPELIRKVDGEAGKDLRSIMDRALAEKRLELRGALKASSAPSDSNANRVDFNPPSGSLAPANGNPSHDAGRGARRRR